jgi:hypothetical protein
MFFDLIVLSGQRKRRRAQACCQNLASQPAFHAPSSTRQYIDSRAHSDAPKPLKTRFKPLPERG